MTASTLLLILVVLWTAFATITFSLPSDTVFHLLNSLSIAAGIMVISVYWAGLADAWRNRRNHLSPGHVLAFGIIANWIGFIMRLGRWYIMLDTPVSNSMPQWAYNIGLWITTTAAFLLTVAVALSDEQWDNRRTVRTAAIFMVTVAALHIFDMAY